MCGELMKNLITLKKNKSSSTVDRLFVFIRPHLPLLTAVLLGTIYFFLRIPFHSQGLDQGDVDLYAKSLQAMTFYREAKWPLLLLFQKVIWLIFNQNSPQEILSGTNVLFASGSIFLTFLIGFYLTRSYIFSLLSPIVLFTNPLFSVYSVVGMQDIPQTFFVLLLIFPTILFLLTKRKIFLYLSFLVFALSLGIRTTQVILLPILLLAVIFNLNILQKITIMKILGVSIAGSLVWLIPQQFIHTPLGSSLVFFLYQVKTFNPFLLGFLTKLSTYALFTGYQLKIFYLFPTLLFLVFVFISTTTKHFFYKLVILIYLTIFSLIAINLLDRYGRFGRYISYLNASYISLGVYLIGLELTKFLKKISKKRTKVNFSYKKIISSITNIESDTKIIAVLWFTFLIYFLFFYFFAGPVTRYLLPIFPISTILISFITWKSLASKSPSSIDLARSIFVVLIFLVIYFSYQKAQTAISPFKQLDTRSALSSYINKHDGQYFWNNAYGLLGYFDFYKVTSKVKITNTSDCSLSLSTNKANFLITFGPENKTLLGRCPNMRLTETTRFVRNETIIEDSVGNLGFYVYKIEKL